MIILVIQSDIKKKTIVLNKLGMSERAARFLKKCYSVLTAIGKKWYGKTVMKL